MKKNSYRVRTLISVTKKHIKKGDRLRSSSCPIALAIMDTGYWPYVEVNGNNVLLYGSGLCIDAALSRRARQFIYKVDITEKKNRKMKPFKFWLEFKRPTFK